MNLYYRNYDPVLGRFGQVDPMASKYGSVSPYNFGTNNPVRYNDPMGDDSYDVLLGILANGSTGSYVASGRGESAYRDMDPFGRYTTARIMAQSLERMSMMSDAATEAGYVNSYDESLTEGAYIKKGTKLGNFFRRIGSIFKGIFRKEQVPESSQYVTFGNDGDFKEQMRIQAKINDKIVVGFFLANGNIVVLPAGTNSNVDWNLENVEHRVKKNVGLQIKVDGGWERANGMFLAYPDYDAFFLDLYNTDRNGRTDQRVIDFYSGHEKSWRARAYDYHIDFLFIFSDRKIGPAPLSDEKFFSIPYHPWQD